MSCQCHRPDLYSSRLGVVLLAWSLPAIFLFFTEMVVALNKSAPDFDSARWPSTLLVSSLRARCPGEVGVAATVTSMQILSSASADVVVLAPTPPWSS